MFGMMPSNACAAPWSPLLLVSYLNWIFSSPLPQSSTMLRTASGSSVQRRLDVEVEVLRERLDHREVEGIAAVPAADRAARERQARIDDDARGVEELRTPRPSQSGQAPVGLLNEKSRGSSSVML